ncbi:eRF1 domain 1-domain-containing protein [Phakopsora pachyrhizi]|uniref:Protein DOM34 homolog n=1 Tax=Phakopsora pachyrhizi TaxID=170000 RepID=A0AAV0AJX1_PHAPC|nr:eRF1 domain 1-domain-containing protein [Phakopsora pachyrhizi]
MKHIRRHIEKNKSGSVTLLLEHDEDLWHAYNLISVGDEIRAPAVRKIISETNSGTGSKESHRVRLNLTIEVKKVIYSGADIPTTDQEGSTSSVGIIPTNNSSSSGEATLHLSGPVSQQNEHVKLGAFHTLDLEPGRQFTIIKGPMGWNYVNIQRIKEATESGRGAELAAILCDDTGKATICLISPHTTLIKKRIEVTIPKKKRPGQGSDKAMEKFYKQIFESVLQYFNLTELKLVIIASPGATKDLVYESIFSEATRTGKKEILTSKSKFQRVYSPSVHIQSLTEVLSSPQVSNQLKDSQYSKEIQALDKFQKMLNSDEHRAWYGEKHVDQAAERGAIGTLLISDTLFRHSDPDKRNKFIKLTKDVKQFGGQVLIFSSMHVSGAKLNEMSGVAAILTYPLDIDVIEAEERNGG